MLRHGRRQPVEGFTALMSTPPPFRVAMTADFCDAAGQPKYRDIGLDVFDTHRHIVHGAFAEHRARIGADQVGDAQGVVVLTAAVTAESVSHAGELLVMARFGVGYDSVDVDACTRAHVLVTIARGAVDRPVAEATVGWMIALGHHLRVKDQLVRTGQWDARSRHMGRELRERTLGVIGLGGIARKLLELLRPFGMNPPLAYDPALPPGAFAVAGTRSVDLETLLRHSDFVSLHCPLNEQTRGLIGAHELAWMRPDAYLIKTARGGIVNEDALFDALREGRIAGAALDCFEEEPVTTPHRFGTLDNVLLAPHSIAWTDELFRDIGRSACQVMVDLSQGRRPAGVLNPEVFDSPEFQAKWRRHTHAP